MISRDEDPVGTVCAMVLNWHGRRPSNRQEGEGRCTRDRKLSHRGKDSAGSLTNTSLARGHGASLIPSRRRHTIADHDVSLSIIHLTTPYLQISQCAHYVHICTTYMHITLVKCIITSSISIIAPNGGLLRSFSSNEEVVKTYLHQG